MCACRLIAENIVSTHARRANAQVSLFTKNITDITVLRNSFKKKILYSSEISTVWV